jgi:hypothetical protein
MRPRLAVLVVMLALTACRSEGPSATDLTKIYRSPVEVLSCAKVNDSTYRCRFKFTNPPTVADRGEHVQCFITDGSSWDIKLWC